MQAHAKGGTFDLVTEAEDGLGVLWRETSRMLVRGLKLEGPFDENEVTEPEALPEVTRWYADGDIGRRYAKVCGDYNPIHLSAVSARLCHRPWHVEQCHGVGSPAHAHAKQWLSLRGGLPQTGALAIGGCPERQRSPAGELRLDGQGGVLHMVGRWAVL